MGRWGNDGRCSPAQTSLRLYPVQSSDCVCCCVGRPCRMALPPSPPVQLHKWQDPEGPPDTVGKSLPKGLLHMLRSTAETSHPTRAAQVLPWTPVGVKNRFPPSRRTINLRLLLSLPLGWQETRYCIAAPPSEVFMIFPGAARRSRSSSAAHSGFSHVAWSQGRAAPQLSGRARNGLRVPSVESL